MEQTDIFLAFRVKIKQNGVQQSSERGFLFNREVKTAKRSGGELTEKRCAGTACTELEVSNK